MLFHFIGNILHKRVPVNSGFNWKLIVHKCFEGFPLLDGKYRPRSISIDEIGRTAVTICVSVRMNN